jgi:putative transposase
MSRRKEPAIPAELLDQLLAGTDAAAALDQGGLLDALKKALAERVLGAEMDHHLGHDDQAGNSRNGYGRKTVLTDTGKIDIDVPRDRSGSFDPQLIAKYQRRFPGFDDKIISMYARGMSTREITGHLRELYGIDVSPDLISTVTDAVLEEVAAWQARPLDPAYPLVFFDAIRVKIRDEGLVRNKVIHIALGALADGRKEVLGLWIEQNEGEVANLVLQPSPLSLLRSPFLPLTARRQRVRAPLSASRPARCSTTAMAIALPMFIE